MKNQLKTDKGTAGLTLLLSMIVMLFIIGLVIMIFSLMGSEMKTATYTPLTSVSVVNESITAPNTAGITLAGGLERNGLCGAVVLVNGTAGTPIGDTNYTQVNCVLTNVTGRFVDEYTTPLATYSYTWSADNTASDVMNDTVVGISGAVDYFDIFIVIGAMIVLIFLTVMIITSIRNSGMIASSGSRGNSVGTA